jgi:Replication initiation factor
MRFDAWNATFSNDVLNDVRFYLETKLGAVLENREHGLHGYKFSELIQIDGVTHGVIAYGGINSRLFVEVKGEPSQVWSEFVQSWADQWQGSDVLVLLTRADVCFDWEDDSDVVALAPSLRRAVEDSVSSERGRPPQWDQRGDWNSPEGRLRGCTLYMGAASSSVRVRLYDKGAELKSRGIDASDKLRRVEVQVRASSKAEKIAWAMHTPEMFWTVSVSVRAVAKHLSVPFDGLMVRVPSAPADLERLKTLAAVQYGDAIAALARDLATGATSATGLVDLLVAEIEKRRRSVLRRAA